MAANTNFWSNATVSGRLWNAHFYKGVTLGGATVFDGDVNVGDQPASPAITFDVNGQTAVIRGGFIVYSSGRLKMTNPAGDLSLQSYNWDGSQRVASFYGGSTDGLLTAGTLRIDGKFEADGAAFSATGSHTTILKDMVLLGGHSLKFYSPGTNNLTSHFGILQFSDQTHSTILSSDVYAVTAVTVVGHTGPVLINRDGSLPAGVAPRLHTANINTTIPFTFDRVAFRIYNADATTTFQNSTFQNFTSSAFEHQLTVEGAGTITMPGMTFSTLSANTYNYLYANNLGAGLNLTFSGVFPTIAGGAAGKIAVTGSPPAAVTWP